MRALGVMGGQDANQFGKPNGKGMDTGSMTLTLSIMTLSIMTPSIMTPSIMTPSITLTP